MRGKYKKKMRKYLLALATKCFRTACHQSADVPSPNNWTSHDSFNSTTRILKKIERRQKIKRNREENKSIPPIAGVLGRETFVKLVLLLTAWRSDSNKCISTDDLEESTDNI